MHIRNRSFVEEIAESLLALLFLAVQTFERPCALQFQARAIRKRFHYGQSPRVAHHRLVINDDQVADDVLR